MVSAEPTRKMVKLLRQAGWTPGKTVGSHTKRYSPDGRTLSIPDGHKMTSPGLVRQIQKAIEDTK